MKSSVPFAVAAVGKLSCVTVRLGPEGPFGVLTTSASAKPAVVNTMLLGAIVTVPEQPAKLKSTASAVIRWSDEIVNVIAPPCAVLPDQLPL
jgi:hypothetical protein